MPEIKTIEIQVPIKRIDWPKSGWLIRSIIIDSSIKKLKKYDVLDVFDPSRVSILAVNSMKKGLTNSIGCKRKKYKFNHLFDPLTSTPINGTSIKAINNKIKIGITVFFNMSNFIKEIENIMNNEIITKIKCLEKKK